MNNLSRNTPLSPMVVKDKIETLFYLTKGFQRRIGNLEEEVKNIKDKLNTPISDNAPIRKSRGRWWGGQTPN